MVGFCVVAFGVVGFGVVGIGDEVFLVVCSI